MTKTKNKTLQNNKTLRVVLNCIMSTAIFMALILLLIHLLASTWDLFIGQWSYFYIITDEGKVAMNLSCSTIYCVLLGIALVALVMHLVIFAIPGFKKGEENAGVKLMCRILICVGIVISILALYLPIGVSYEMIDKNTLATPWTAATVLGWIGTPLAFASCAANLGLSFRVESK